MPRDEVLAVQNCRSADQQPIKSFQMEKASDVLFVQPNKTFRIDARDSAIREALVTSNNRKQPNEPKVSNCNCLVDCIAIGKHRDAFDTYLDFNVIWVAEELVWSWHLMLLFVDDDVFESLALRQQVKSNTVILH